MYAQYARTMLEAQRFELTLIGMVVHFLPESDEPAPADELERTLHYLFKSSAGRLAKAIEWPEGLVEDVAMAISTRDELAHNYLLDHFRHVQRRDGRMRARMLRNLEEIAENFRDLDGRVEKEAERLAEEAGWTEDEETRRRAEELFRAALAEEDRRLGLD